MSTTVVNLRYDKYDVYIGRGSKWGNPFVIGKDGDRNMVIDKYEKYILNHPILRKLIKKELKGKILGCYCKPERCHGDILAKLADKKGK
jgi:hypothetical protein